MGFDKELRAEAIKNYNKAIDSIPEKVWYHDTARNIGKLWESRGRGRTFKPDLTRGFPRYVFLNLGPFDRLGVEVNFFVEEIEEKFGLQFIDAEIGASGPMFKYGENKYDPMLQVFFMINDNGSCHIIEKEAEPTVFKNYERQIICDE